MNVIKREIKVRIYKKKMKRKKSMENTKMTNNKK
jgi:hypothetical protein